MEKELSNPFATAKDVWTVGFGPKEYGTYLLNKRGYSHKRTNKKR